MKCWVDLYGGDDSNKQGEMPYLLCGDLCPVEWSELVQGQRQLVKRMAQTLELSLEPLACYVSE